MVGLGEKGNNGDTGVSSNNGNLLVGGVGALDLRDEARSTDDVEGGDTEEALGVVDTLGLEDLGGDGDGGVDGVGDDEDVGVGGVLSSGLGQVADNGGVGVEQVVTGHTGLAGNTSGDEDDLGSLKGSLESLRSGVVSLDGALGVDVGDVGGDTWGNPSVSMLRDMCDSMHTGSSADVVEGEVRDTLVELQEEGQRLSNSSGGTENGDLGVLFPQQSVPLS